MIQPLAKATKERNFFREPIFIFLGLGFVFLVLVIITKDNYQIGAYLDDAHYIVLARSLAAGKGYAYLNYPETVNATPIVPIGFPLLLAPLIVLFPQAFALLRLVPFVSTVLNGILLYHFWPSWTRSSKWWGVAIAGSYWLLPTGVLRALLVMSEPEFLTVYLLLLAVVVDYLSARRKWWQLPGIFLLAVGLIATRTIGVAIVAGVGFTFLLDRRYYASWRIFARMIAILLTCTFLIGLLLLNNSILPQRYWNGNDAWIIQAILPGNEAPEDQEEIIEAEPIQGEVVTEGKRFQEKVWEHINTDIPQTILPLTGSITNRINQGLIPPTVQTALGLGIFGLILLGGVRWIRHTGWHVVWITGLFYVGALLIWNWRGIRLLYPIVPHIVYAFLLGCGAVLQPILGRWQRRSGQQVACFFIAAIVGFMLLTSAIIDIRLLPSTAYVGDLTHRTIWLKENATPDQIVMSEYPQLDYLYGQTQTLDCLPFENTADLLDYLNEHNVDYLLLAPEVALDSRQDLSIFSINISNLAPLVDTLEEQTRVVNVYDNSDYDGVVIFRYEEKHDRNP